MGGTGRIVMYMIVLIGYDWVLQLNPQSTTRTAPTLLL